MKFELLLPFSICSGFNIFVSSLLTVTKSMGYEDRTHFWFGKVAVLGHIVQAVQQEEHLLLKYCWEGTKICRVYSPAVFQSFSYLIFPVLLPTGLGTKESGNNTWWFPWIIPQVYRNHVLWAVHTILCSWVIQGSATVGVAIAWVGLSHENKVWVLS